MRERNPRGKREKVVGYWAADGLLGRNLGFLVEILRNGS